ncbi:ornithine carbamoyltransferase [Rhizobium sp. NPDC090279]|uniref:ornithine carbamoyltransferase n=1 Tax=Rhizobium sp. NPDC090279 TaxID=3364499 RepID=UPI00383A5C37
MKSKRRSLISLNDIRTPELVDLVARSVAFSSGATSAALDGRNIGIFFTKTSTRTRTAFSVGAQKLGAGIISFAPSDLQLSTGESIEDTAHVLSLMLDGLVIRTAGDPAEMIAFAAHGRMAVVNAMSAEEHPTQAIADLATMHRHFGRIEGLTVLYVGEGNNTAAALALGLARFAGVTLELRTPKGYGIDRRIIAAAHDIARENGARIVERHDMHELPIQADVVYATRWQTTGTTKPDPDWRSVFAPFKVDGGLMKHCRNAVFMHDLPAHRGEDVTADVIDGPRSIAFLQASFKLYSAMAVLEWSIPN